MRIAFCLAFALCMTKIGLAQEAPIIPRPVSYAAGTGEFIIDKNTAVIFNPADPDLKAAADYFSSYLQQISGLQLAQNKRQQKSIEFKIEKIAEVGAEGYLLNVSPASIRIVANNKTGIVYGLQSLFQVLPAVRTNAVLRVPAMQVKDYPRFKWRGMMLDVSRHFFSPDFVKKYIDLMAMYKFNTFHWHLTDDQGWRIEIKKYPKLTEVGAWRVDQNDKIWTRRPQASPGQQPTYGGYYTQEQVKDIVKYAAARNITIVPEIEIPGHSAAAIAAYPWLSCSQQPQLPMTGGNFTHISSNYCAGNDSAFVFLQDVLTEVTNLFPSAYIHIGGDEVEKSSWRKCPKCQRRMQEEGLKTVDELQSYFIKRMEKYLAGKNRKIIGWDEILEGGLAPSATVMSWRGEQGGVDAARMRHDVIMTPSNPVYFDYYQGDPATEPIAFGGFNTLKTVYDYEPVPKELDDQQARYVLGAQANLWGEYISTPGYAEYMVLPRMLALSEGIWSPKGTKDWNDFNERLIHHFNIFDQRGWHYSRGNFKVDIQPFTQEGKLFANLSTEAYKGEVYYTTDGSAPGLGSNKFTGPIPIQSSLTLKAVTVAHENIMSVIPEQQSFVLHKALGATVSYVHPVNRSYRAEGEKTLVDGVRGTLAHHKNWHGFEARDMIATLDLGQEKNIQRIAVGCLQKYRDWIMMPEWVKFEVSSDGKNFTGIQTVANDVSVNEQSPLAKDFVARFAERKARFIRVTAKVLGALPVGHSGAGRAAWLFVDEVVVE